MVPPSHFMPSVSSIYVFDSNTSRSLTAGLKFPLPPQNRNHNQPKTTLLPPQNRHQEPDGIKPDVIDNNNGELLNLEILVLCDAMIEEIEMEGLENLIKAIDVSDVRWLKQLMKTELKLLIFAADFGLAKLAKDATTKVKEAKGEVTPDHADLLRLEEQARQQSPGATAAAIQNPPPSAVGDPSNGVVIEERYMTGGKVKRQGTNILTVSLIEGQSGDKVDLCWSGLEFVTQ
ncbi:hypothetical protein L2E82_37901 [Cichorium intybus]|uniref:Uncharacterized protein n=1 Tax=Cichorium intybus TaxID=13427 RepID=A0ACB9AG84_CICIN|nr:hypothetical protein L2E82_37901 [Cichorium intybus]